MTSKPYPNRNVKVMVSWLFFLLFILLSSLLLAAEMRSRFELTTPEKIIAGQEFSLTFTARKDDQTPDLSLNGTFLFQASTFGRAISKELQVKKGTGKLNLTLSQATTYIFTLKSDTENLYSGHLNVEKEKPQEDGTK